MTQVPVVTLVISATLGKAMLRWLNEDPVCDKRDGNNIATLTGAADATVLDCSAVGSGIGETIYGGGVAAGGGGRGGGGGGGGGDAAGDGDGGVAGGKLPPVNVLFILAFVRLVVVGGIQFFVCAKVVLPYFFPQGNIYMKIVRRIMLYCHLFLFSSFAFCSCSRLFMFLFLVLCVLLCVCVCLCVSVSVCVLVCLCVFACCVCE